MFIETNPIPAKEALALMGIIERGMRLPLCDLQAKNHELLKECLAKYKLI
jgi:4-hydroxy-tetrahydrodipicolinate synthase